MIYTGRLATLIARLVHKLYKIFISPVTGNRCRFYPSCSDYSLEAIEQHGFLSGCLLSIKRIVRCNPYCKGGVDPVPTAQNRGMKSIHG